jgi:hypothetical protein
MRQWYEVLASMTLSDWLTAIYIATFVVDVGVLFVFFIMNWRNPGVRLGL